ncbi:MAG: ABC transporter substrate-binding protein [Bacteroidetes bacterium]|nr:ABC transporter substrate-binding protein [Bacteroidota bacterium]
METPLHRTVILLLSLLATALPGRILAQQLPLIPYNEQAEKAFEYGLLQYDLQAWDSAARQFEQIIRDLPLNHRTTASFVMAARCRLQERKPSPALRLIEQFWEQHQESSYLAEACLIAGDAGVAAGSRSTALRWYLRAWQAQNADRTLLAQRFTDLQPTTFTPMERRVIEEEVERGADSTLDALLQGTPAEQNATAHAAPAVPNATSPKPTDDRPVRIVAALPKHESDARRAGVVRDLRDGMLAAVDIHRAAGQYPVAFELIDSGDPDSLRPVLRRLEQDDRAMVLIAGAFSEDAEQISALAAEGGMLVLLPTATAEGIVEVGSNIFQLNTPILHRARLLADFVYLELDVQQAMVIAPDDSYARAMAEAFIGHAKNIGLEIRFTGWYDTDDTDLSGLCRRAAATGAKNGILFAPVKNRSDIANVLEGMRTAQLHIPVVGGGNWNHPDLVSRHGRDHVLYFEADVDADTTTEMYHTLCETFAGRSARPLSREALFGFDAMRVALQVAAKPNTTRKDVRHRIRNVFDGLRAPVNFLDQRINAAMNIIECRRGVLLKHEAFHAK